jgi:hypothetical protein
MASTAHILPHKQQLNMYKVLHLRGLSLPFEQVSYIGKNIIILFDISKLKRELVNEWCVSSKVSNRFSSLRHCVRFCNKDFNIHESTSVTENCAYAVVTSYFGTNLESDVIDILEQEKIHLWFGSKLRLQHSYVEIKQIKCRTIKFALLCCTPFVRRRMFHENIYNIKIMLYAVY